MEDIKTIDAATLNKWLESHKDVSILDIRTAEDRKEWYIPGSYHIDAYRKLKQHDPHALDEFHPDRTVPVVTVCGGGKTSSIAADMLQKKGYEVYSLQDGMRGWSLAWNKAVLNFKDYQIIQLRRTGKGCLSYIISANNEAIIVDASLPVEVYEHILQENNWQIKSVMETHIHADHLSRSKQIADKFQVPLLLPAHNKVQFDFKKLANDEMITIGETAIKVMATPGHTIESVCFLINNEVLVSGDTLFTNAVGRPDLKANEEEVKKRAELLYDSLQKLLQLNDNIIVLPAHTGAPVNFDDKPVDATLAEIKKNVPVLKLDKESFVKNILDKLPPPPSNYLTIVEKNLSGDISDVNPIELEAGANRCAIS
jgi:glyoxylase-like metal-dependent hydrolase (beta-lactamase superfamily II)/rhodanese-related sulfurtransferase